MAPIDTWSVSLTKLRNLFVDGSVGSVYGRNVKNFAVAMRDLVTSLVKTNGVRVVMLRHYQIAPANAGAATVHAAISLTAQAQGTITTAITNPDFPRVLSITGNQANEAGDVVITGTNVSGAVITDTIALNGAAKVVGTKAFKTVTNIAVPALTTAGDTVTIGTENIFGLPFILSKTTFLLFKLFDNAADAGTLAVDDNEVEKNLFTLAGTPNGTKVMDLFFVV